MNPILRGLDEGYSPEDIIGYLSKAIPQFVPAIKKAKSAGYSVQQILGFLSKNFDKEDRKGLSESERHSLNRKRDAELTKHGLKMAATAAAVPLAGIAGRAALSRALPASLAPSVGQSNIGNEILTQTLNEPQQSLQSEQLMQSTQTQFPNQLSNSSQQPPINASILSQNTSKMQPEVISLDVDKILNDTLSKGVIDNLIRSGNGPEQIVGYFKKFSPESIKSIEKKSGNSFQKVVSDYFNSHKNDVEVEEISPKIEKSSLVASRKGMGQVKEIRNGKALIDVDGKKHQINEDELISSPLPEKDLADLYDDLIGGIESQTGQSVSRNVDWAGYDPINNELAYKPHGSDQLYAYEDISPEDVEVLTSFLTQRKSTGQNFIGAWEKGSNSPIGAAMYQLIKKLQAERGGKGNEYKNKFLTIYDALEPAKKAAKKKHAERSKKT